MFHGSLRFWVGGILLDPARCEVREVAEGVEGLLRGFLAGAWATLEECHPHPQANAEARTGPMKVGSGLSAGHSRFHAGLEECSHLGLLEMLALKSR